MSFFSPSPSNSLGIHIANAEAFILLPKVWKIEQVVHLEGAQYESIKVSSNGQHHARIILPKQRGQVAPWIKAVSIPGDSSS